MCAPGEQCEGGIAAVVSGLLDGLGKLDAVACTRIVYAKPYDDISAVQRLIHELLQYLNYVRCMLVMKPDIVHVQSSFDRKTILRDALYLAVSRLTGRKFVLHAHGGAWHQRAGWSPVWQHFSRVFLESCSVVLVTSEEEKIQVAEISGGINVAKTDNPVKLPDNLRGVVRQVESHQGRKYRLIFASRLIEAKGILETVNAFVRLGRTDCELHVFGEGPFKEEAQDIASASGRSADIFFRGNVPLEDLIREYVTSDVYLFPSFHHEGFPMTLFFAAACGLPIVCTAVRPLPDFFREPDNCLWVEPRNPEMLAEKIHILLDDNGMRTSMSQNNLQLSERFDSRTIGEGLLAIYADLTGR